MKAREALKREEYNSIKKSYFNIYSLFLSEDNVRRSVVDCIMKWGLQLELTEDELKELISNRVNHDNAHANREEAIEKIYDVVYMIYLDDVVEDIELEVASLYAEKLGFPSHVVGDMLKAIVSAPSDGIDHFQLRKDIKLLLHSDR